MKVISATISEVKEGQELAEDLFVNGCKLLSKGRKLTPQIIKILEARRIEGLRVVQYGEDELGEIEEINIDDIEIDLNYLDSLSSLNIETRYGLAAHKEEVLTKVFDIYNELEQHVEIRQLLKQLKNYDTYTFLHSLDVFTLGTLFAHHLNLPMLKRIAIGYLLHDIGKLTVSFDIINKPGKLTRQEFDVVKAHVTEGDLILRKAGFGNIAYFANLHHERFDGSGYPNGLKGNMLSEEVAILHIIDTYSALTLRRSYRKDKNSSDAMTVMCQDRHLFKEDLLYKFINFIGIYPEEAKVMLTNGQEVCINRTIPNYPLLPEVKCATTGNLFTLPTDFQVRISRILSFEPDTKEQTCKKLFNYLITCNKQMFNEFYNELSEQYLPQDLYLRVVIPIYKSLMVLKGHGVINGDRYIRAVELFKEKIYQTNCDLGIINKREKTFIVVLPKHFKVSVEMLILEGLLHVDGIYPIVVHDAENKSVIRSMSNSNTVNGMIIFENNALKVDIQGVEYKTYDLTMKTLVEYVCRFHGIQPSEFDVLEKLARYERLEEEYVI